MLAKTVSGRETRASRLLCEWPDVQTSAELKHAVRRGSEDRAGTGIGRCPLNTINFTDSSLHLSRILAVHTGRSTAGTNYRN